MNPESNAGADLHIAERTTRPGFGDFFNRLKWVAYVLNSDTWSGDTWSGAILQLKLASSHLSLGCRDGQPMATLADAAWPPNDSLRTTSHCLESKL
jgi:hypothetical protein